MTVMNERQMMASEVHDSLAQTLAYMKMRIALLLEAQRAGAGERALKYATDLQGALGEAYSEPAADIRGYIEYVRSQAG